METVIVYNMLRLLTASWHKMAVSTYATSFFTASLSEFGEPADS